MRPSQIKEILEREFRALDDKQHTPVMLWGPPGVGKSDITAQVAATFQVPLIDLRLSQLEPTDLRGIPFRVENRVEWSVPAVLPDENRHGPAGILFLDELTAAPPSVTAAAYQLILDRRLGDYRVPPGWAIVAASNRHGDRGVIYAMPAPLANRFTHYQVEPDLADWTSWALDHGIDERLIGFLFFRPELLFAFDAAKNPLAFPSPRSWEYVHRAIQKFGGQQHLLLEAIQACVGEIAGLEFKAFLDHLQDMPDVDAILRGEIDVLPQSIDQIYGMAAALVRRARDVRGSGDAASIYQRILQFAHSLPQRELGVMIVTEVFRCVGRELLQVPAFAVWAQDIADLMLYDVYGKAANSDEVLNS